MTLKEFIDKWNGKPCDFDGIYGTQCMDLMHFFVYEYLGLKDKTILAAPGAAQVWSDFKWDSYFEKITNAPDNHPEPGDIVLWDTRVGPYGHVAICWDSTLDDFNSFDANWPIGSLPHIQHHDYSGVAGWLRAKKGEDTVPVEKSVFERLVFKSSCWDAIVEMGYSSAEDIRRREGALQATIEGLNKEYSELQQERNILKDSLEVVNQNLDRCVYKKGDYIANLNFIHTLVQSSWLTYLRSRKAIADKSAV